MKTLLILLALSPYILFSQSKKELKEVERRLSNLVDFLDTEVGKDSLKIWTQWVGIGESEDIEDSKRKEAWKNFLLSMYNHLETIPDNNINKQSLASWSNFLVSPNFKGRILDIRKIEKTTPANQLGDVHITGSGNQTIMLIPPFGVGWDIFEEFIDRNRDNYRFIGLSFPGAYNISPYQYPDKRDPSKAAWISQIENGILDLVKDQGIEKFYLMALGTGMYTAMRISQVIPEKVEGIISVNGSFISSLADPDDNNKRASLEYRKLVNDKAFPLHHLIQITPSFISNQFSLTANVEKNQKYISQISPETVNSTLRYIQEFKAQDLFYRLDDFNIPILNLLSFHDEKSAKVSNLAIPQFWEELKLDKPYLPITTLYIPNARDAAFIDNPELFEHYAYLFLKKEKIIPLQIVKPVMELSKPSPYSSIRQHFGSVDIVIDYHRPFIKNRKIFGELVPYENVWRAGANEATKVFFSNDVEVNGHFLKKGTYSFFVIPDKNKWTIVFNNIVNQWGAFNYKQKYDALRFDIEPEKNKFSEALKYDFENLKNESVDITMAWETSKMRLTINEIFNVPSPPEAMKNIAWVKVLEDKEGDGRQDDLTDGKSLSYYLDPQKDTLWFKFELYKPININAFAMNILLDIDGDQQTGINWFGTNTGFTFDKVLTLWMRREGSRYAGINGISDSDGVMSNQWDKLKKNNIKFYLDVIDNTYIVGVSKSDLGIQNSSINFIGAVGEYMTWNDDIGDDEFATIELK